MDDGDRAWVMATRGLLGLGPQGTNPNNIMLLRGGGGTKKFFLRKSQSLFLGLFSYYLRSSSVRGHLFCQAQFQLLILSKMREGAILAILHKSMKAHRETPYSSKLF